MNIYRLMHGLFHTCILPLISALFLSVEGWWQGQYEKGHVLIYSSHILPGQITCYCPRKRLLPQRQITRRKLCFYYTCKFGVISIKYVIKNHIALQGSTLTVVRLPRASEMRLRASENGTQLVRSSKWKWFCDMFNSWRAKWLILNYSVLEVPANFT